MQKQLEILKHEIADFKKDPNISGVLLIGSVAYDAATESSDLDILCLCGEDRFVSKYVDGILVEIHFHSFETIIQRLQKNPMEVYRYLYSKIQYEDGKLSEIIRYAKSIYESYATPANAKKDISYWLSSTKIKLYSALQEQNELKVSYIVSTNTWKVLEGIWAANNKPMPPFSLVFFSYKMLTNVPCPNWFTELLTNDIMSRGRFACQVIDWIVEKLKG